MMLSLTSADALAAATAALSTAQKLAKKAAASVNCAVNRYAGDPANPTKSFVDSYPHCFRMPYRQPGADYDFTIPGCGSVAGCGSTVDKTVTVTSSEFAAADKDTLTLPKDSDGTPRAYAYNQIEHIWCYDPNPPLRKPKVDDPDTVALVPITNCRPFAFTLCSDGNGSAAKTAALATLPSHLCGKSLYDARWQSFIHDPMIPAP